VTVLTVIVQWFRVILGISWFGFNLAVDTFLTLTLTSLSLTEQQKVVGL
jgi:hypothetical protein